MNLTFILILNIDIVDIAIIDINAYYLVCKLKKTQIFAISLRNLEFYIIKKVMPKTNLKFIISKEYYNILDIFLKKNLDILSFYQKYDHKIILEKE